MLTYNLDGDEVRRTREAGKEPKRGLGRGVRRSIPWGSIDRSIDGSHPSVTRLSRSPRGSWSSCETDERRERERERERDSWMNRRWNDTAGLNWDRQSEEEAEEREKERERERERERKGERDRKSPEGPLVAQLSHLPIGPSHVLICLLVNPASLLSFISFLPFVEPSAPPPSPRSSPFNMAHRPSFFLLGLPLSSKSRHRSPRLASALAENRPPLCFAHQTIRHETHLRPSGNLPGEQAKKWLRWVQQCLVNLNLNWWIWWTRWGESEFSVRID